MFFFLLTFISIYTCMNALVYMRTRVLVPPQWPFQAVLIGFLVFMIFAPICTRLLERAGFEALARIFALGGYFWMGFVFIAFCIFLLAILMDLAGAGVNLVLSTRIPGLAGKGATAGLLGIVLALSVYGCIEARSVRVERVVLRTDKLPAGTDRLKIAQISDVHIGLIVGSERVRLILDRVREENPDLLVSTGDLLDGNAAKHDGVTEQFKALQPRLGKFAVTGNHEFYAGLAESIATTERYGFTMLRGAAKVAGNTINIVGVDDPVTGGVQPDESKLLGSAANGLFTLFLKHRPDPAGRSLGLFDLQLSGHTHLGQIFPFRYVTALVYPKENGFYELEKGSALYTSRGSGTWGPPMRVLAPPEVTVIELVRPATSGQKG